MRHPVLQSRREDRIIGEQIPFVLAQASVNASPPFPIVVLDDEAAIAVDALAPLAARLGLALTGTDSVAGLLRDWPRNLAALSAAVLALDDGEQGKYTRSAVAALAFFDLQAPLPAPKQVFRMGAELEVVPVSTLAGPRAKVPMLPETAPLTASLAACAVIGAPCYRATPAEAADAFAGMMVATQYRDAAGAMLAPALLPTGPYMVPAAFCADRARGRIAFNGETGFDATIETARAVDVVAAVSRHVHLFPGDLVILPLDAGGSVPLGDGDIIETAIEGLGQQTTNVMMESKHAHPRD